MNVTTSAPGVANGADATKMETGAPHYPPPKDPNATHGVDIPQLKAELAALDPDQFPVAHKLLKSKLDTTEFNVCTDPEYLIVDAHVPMRMCRKVRIPMDRNLEQNYVGKIIGAGGKTLQELAKANKCRIVVCGKNTTKDPEKEQQLLATGDPKYQHYKEQAHVKVETIGGATTAYSRMLSVLQQIEQILQPWSDGTLTAPGGAYAPRPPMRGRGRGVGGMRGGMPRPPRPPPPASTAYPGYDYSAPPAGEGYASAYDYGGSGADPAYDYSGYSADYYAPPAKRAAPEQPAVPGYGAPPRPRGGGPRPPAPAAGGYGGYGGY